MINKSAYKSNRSFWHEVMKTLREAKKYFIDYNSDLFRSFKGAKPSTKLIVGGISIVVFIMGSVSVIHSINSLSEKQRVLDQLDYEIEEQIEINQKLEDELQGDLDAYVEEQARFRLDMVYPDEQIFINMAG